MVFLWKSYNKLFGIYDEYFWRIMHYGGIERLIPTYLSRLNNEWKKLEDFRLS
jgi:hypothetical protein